MRARPIAPTVVTRAWLRTAVRRRDDSVSVFGSTSWQRMHVGVLYVSYYERACEQVRRY
jgi:hypothetical protein